MIPAADWLGRRAPPAGFHRPAAWTAAAAPAIMVDGVEMRGAGRRPAVAVAADRPEFRRR
ncbi:MAG: hypothetical protein DCC67_18480 [Planctomycetota bacterium]|nr:MAG: hypothetical protein DCC67_18480 [Planctomycetota bacterium]